MDATKLETGAEVGLLQDGSWVKGVVRETPQWREGIGWSIMIGAGGVLHTLQISKRYIIPWTLVQDKIDAGLTY